MIALATAGCIGSIGSDAPSSSSGASTSQEVGTLPPRTNLLITYTAPTCPPGARCAFVPGSPKYYLQSRRLTCSPDGGDYDHPAAACRALSDVVTKLGAKRSVCSCFPAVPPAKAVGYYNGKRRTIPLDACSLCGLPGTGADTTLLLPGALS
jgi:hypothetical protein